MSDEMRDDAHEPATKGDLGVMRSDMAMMRTDIASMRDDLTLAIRKEIREALRPIFITLAHHTAELADIRGHIKDKMVTRDEFYSRMDALEEKRA